MVQEQDRYHNGCPELGFREERGIALVITLVGLCLLTLVGLFITASATTEIRISDNHESTVRARFAAQAGINHAGALLRGLDHDGLLNGPDGIHSADSGYVISARAVSFRNPIDWGIARSLDVSNPAGYPASSSDDGVLGIKRIGAATGVVLIPQVGFALTAPDPYGSGTITTARYFVKVADNNGESSEIALDPLDDPFTDGDGVIIVRSVGVAPTLIEATGSSFRRNSLAAFEARFKRETPFHRLSSPVVIIGSDVRVDCSQNAFMITGGSAGPGIATIDSSPSDALYPDLILKLGTAGKGSITGSCPPVGGAPETNCISDISARIAADSLSSRMMNPDWLYDFIYRQVPGFSDNTWDGKSPVDLGSSVDPKVTWVNGNLALGGGAKGAGLLVVSGDLRLEGPVIWEGLILVAGSGFLSVSGENVTISGILLAANISMESGRPVFGTPSIELLGTNSLFIYDRSSLSLAVRLLPSKQISFREITAVIDP